jgi:nicotinate-nucleotide pyrophosphorylase (carboxylating)
VSTRNFLYPQIAPEPAWIEEQISRFLEEDRADEDITTEAVVPEGIEATACLEAGQDLIFAGAQIIPLVFKEPCDVKLSVDDGAPVALGELIATVTGPARHLLTRERVMLNLIQHLSGIATLTRTYADLAAPYGVVILDTRKTLPGLRQLEKYAVAIGGGTNHRLDLFSGILVKDNHLAVGGVTSIAIDRLRLRYPDRPIEVEVETEAQILAGLEAGVDALLLDNMTVEQVRDYVKLIRKHPKGSRVFLEASGGIGLEDVEAYAQAGIDGISIGRLTHSAPAVDICMELTL